MKKPKVHRKPDYRIRALCKSNNVSAEIGTAYKEEGGRIRVWFNPFVNVPTGPDFVISFFPENKYPDRPAPAAEPPSAPGESQTGEDRFGGLELGEGGAPLGDLSP